MAGHVRDEWFPGHELSKHHPFTLPLRSRLTLGRAVMVLGLIAAGLLMRRALLPLLGDHGTYLTIYPMVVVSALLWGKLPGVLAAAVGQTCTDLLFADPSRLLTSASAISFVIVVGSALFLGQVGDRWRRTEASSKAAANAARAAETLAKQRLTELESLYETSPIGLCVFDENLRWVRVNQRIAEINGKPIEDHIGKTPSEVVPDVGAQAEDALRQILRTGERLDFEMTGTTSAQPGMQRVWSEHWVPIKDSNGRITGISVAAEEITEHKRAERAVRENEARYRELAERLRASEEKFRSVFEQAAIGMARVSFEDARWIDVNDVFCRMLGRTREEMLATPWPLMTHRDDVALDLAPFRRMAAGDLGSYTVEKRFMHSQGHVVWARLTLSLVRDAAGRPDYEIAIIEDITDRKAAEQSLQQANEQLVDLDRRKNEFIAMLSHELRNPLTPICNSIQILERAAPGGEQASRARDVIQRQAEHMTRLIDDLLDVTRISRGKINLLRERVDLGVIVRRTAEDHRQVFERQGIALEVEGRGEPLWVDGDPTRLAQVVGNLLTNSAKFTPAGGRTVLRVEADSNGAAIVRVRDDGAGMSPDTLEHLFEPFVQAAQTIERTRGGLGLGLALVKGVIEMHGGTVAAYSEGEGKGSEIVVTLPRRSAPEATSPRVGLESKNGSVVRRVLVIEDNVDAAETLREALELRDHVVAVAHSGPEGVEQARRHKPDVVLCDIGLPGMDGYDVVRALRADPDAALNSAFLVALSGYALQEDVIRAKQAGFDRHLAKPPSLEALDRLLAEVPLRS